MADDDGKAAAPYSGGRPSRADGRAASPGAVRKGVTVEAAKTRVTLRGVEGEDEDEEEEDEDEGKEDDALGRPLRVTRALRSRWTMMCMRPDRLTTSSTCLSIVVVAVAARPSERG